MKKSIFLFLALVLCVSCTSCTRLPDHMSRKVYNAAIDVLKSVDKFIYDGQDAEETYDTVSNSSDILHAQTVKSEAAYRKLEILSCEFNICLLSLDAYSRGFYTFEKTCDHLLDARNDLAETLGKPTR